MEKINLESVFPNLPPIIDTLGRVDFKDIIVGLIGLLVGKGQWKYFKKLIEELGVTEPDANYRKVMNIIARLKWAIRVNTYLDTKGRIRNDPTKGHWEITPAGKEAAEALLEFLNKWAILIRNQRE